MWLPGVAAQVRSRFFEVLCFPKYRIKSIITLQSNKYPCFNTDNALSAVLYEVKDFAILVAIIPRPFSLKVRENMQ